MLKKCIVWSMVAALMVAAGALGQDKKKTKRDKKKAGPGKKKTEPDKKTGPLDKAMPADIIYGPKITPATARGRVVFFQYWGINCSPCRASFPNLVAMQKKYAPSGKFTVIASHVQKDEKAARTFCRQMKVNFPVYHQLRLPKAPCGKTIPSAYLFNHKGKIAGKGHPVTLYAKVGALVRAAPAKSATKAGDAPTSPMLKDVELDRLKYLEKTLIPGRSIRSTMAGLETKAKREDKTGSEAKAVLKSVKAWIIAQLEEAKGSSKTQPAKAMVKADMLVRTLRGMPGGKEAEAILKRLKSDRSVAMLASIVRSLDALKDRIEQRGPSKITKREATAVKGRISSFLRRRNLGDAVKAEAKEMLKSVKELEEADKKPERG